MNDIYIEQTVPLDYTNSNDAAEIDNGIRSTIRGIRLSILALGIGLATIKSKGLYSALNCRSMAEYIERLSDDAKMDRSSIFNWLCIGEAYIKYKTDLELIGFGENDGPTKLPYLDRALALRQKQEVFDNIKDMSLREFIGFSKGEPAEPAEDVPLVNVRGNTVYINGRLAIILSKNPGKRITAYFKKVIQVACEALEEGEVVLPVRLRSMREARRFTPVIERLKKEMRTVESS